MAEITTASKKGDRNTNFHSANLLHRRFGARKMVNQIAHCWYLKIACLSTTSGVEPDTEQLTTKTKAI